MKRIILHKVKLFCEISPLAGFALSVLMKFLPGVLLGALEPFCHQDPKDRRDTHREGFVFFQKLLEMVNPIFQAVVPGIRRERVIESMFRSLLVIVASALARRFGRQYSQGVSLCGRWVSRERVEFFW